MSMKHTPGPWKIQRQNPSPTTGEWMIAGSTPGYLAEVRDCGSGNVHANARLVAAAPDLLEALQEMLQGIEEECHEPSCAECLPWRKARAAIAKATGETA